MQERTELEGVFNISSPNPLTNNAFMQTLQQATGNTFGLPAFEWLLHLGAAIIVTETELILKSRWVMPTKLQEAGFTFMYANLQDAISDIVGKVARKKYRLF